MKNIRPVYKIFNNTTHNSSKDIRMWFDLNGNDYEFVDRDYSGLVDFFLLNDYNSSTKLNIRQRLKFAIFHGFEDFVRHHCNRQDCYVITNGWDPEIKNDRIIFNDFLFNRTKAYYSQYPFSLDTHQWYYHDSSSYKSPRLIKSDSKKKIFVCPGKTHNGQRKYRTQLMSKIKTYNTLGYIGNYDDNPDIFLYSQADLPPNITTIVDIEKANFPMLDSWGYSPPHVEYYKNTFISIYGETIEYGNTIMITEKTWDPLIKGHFILPFSCCNFIQRLKDIGIVFPDFIDYSYDSEPDNDKRWQLYSNEVDRLLNIDLDTWRQHWNDNLDLLLANQRYFQERNYDRVDLAGLLEQ